MTINSSPSLAAPPTSSNLVVGVVVPMPTLPPVNKAEYVAFENVDVPVKVLADVPDWVYAPSLVIPEMPVIAPVVEISQSEELRYRVSPLSPMVRAPPGLIAKTPAVVILVVNCGEVPKTKSPEPVSSDMDKAALAEDIDVVNAPPVVVDTNLSAVRPENVIVPEEVRPVNPDATPAEEISQSLELIAMSSPPSPKTTAPLAVNIPFEVNPDVAVIRPEMVGVAVHDVGDMVNAEPAMVVAYEALPKVMAPSPEYVVPLNVAASKFDEAEALVKKPWPA